jgi:predicted phosphoribosyltransferase
VQIIDEPELRGRIGVFEDREDAGRALAWLLGPYCGPDTILLAVPAGGVPVAASAAEALRVAIDIAVVSKITHPRNTELGFGAVAFDGTVRLNAELVRDLGLSSAEQNEGIQRTLEKVRRRVERLRGGRPLPEVAGREAILVDDGIASGFTLGVAAEAVKRLYPASIAIAAPTGHRKSVERLAGEVDTVFCANIRGGVAFAVADAYRCWSDVDEEEVRRIFARSAFLPSAGGRIVSPV